MSPVTTAFDPNPRRVRNIFICSDVVFCASSRITNASFSVRPRMNAIGATSIVPRSTSRVALLGVHHVVERVVERTQIRVHLLLQVARQEPELLAGFDRRARQDDAADLLGQQVADRLRHRQVGLARAGGADAEDDVVLLDRLEILPLVDALRVDAAPRALGLLLPALQEVVAQIDVGVVDDAAAPRSSRRRCAARSPRPSALVSWSKMRSTRCSAALSPSTMSSSPCVRIVDVQQRLDVLEVGVVRAVERLDAFLRQGNLSSRLSNLQVQLPQLLRIDAATARPTSGRRRSRSSGTR